MSADPYDAVQDARSDRSEWSEGDVADDAAEAFRWGYTADAREPEDSAVSSSPAPSDRDAHVAATTASPGHFLCPNCEKAEYPNEVGVVVCKSCGATIETSEPPTPCTCTVACIPEGLTDEQTCRLRMENESIRVRDLRHLPSCAIFNGSSACSCLAVVEAVKRIPGGAA